MRIAVPPFLLVVVFASVASAQNPLSALKKLEVDGLAGSALGELNACQPLAPSPFGDFIPADVTVVAPGGTLTLPSPLPPSVPLPSITVTIPGEAFLPPAPRLCRVEVSGVSAGSPPHPPGQSTFRLNLVVDFSTYRSNGSGGGCSLASGTLAFTKAARGNPERLTMTHAGLLCDSDGIGSPKTYTATYNVTGGTRKYAGAGGTGDMALSIDTPETVLHLEGNVLFR
jgi:hypothetical protein